MNFVKKFVVGKRSTSDNATRDRTLALHHLRRLFLEYLHPNQPCASRREHEAKLYFMLPVFLKIFVDGDPHEIVDRFGDVFQFAGHLADLMVREMQARAANKSREEASIELIQFLIDTETEQNNHGFNLLCVLSILANGDAQVVECMAVTTLPSTLAKGLRLFFLLPPRVVPEDKIHAVQTVYISMLVRLCHHMVTAQELMQTNELAALFDALTKSCYAEHMIWRTGVSEVVTAITRHCLSAKLINYLDYMKCISLSIANIEQTRSSDPLAVVEMFVTLICVLKDSAEASDVLLESFSNASGYRFMRELLIEFSVSHEDAARNLATVVSQFVLTGHDEIELKSNIKSPFDGVGAKHPLSHKPSGAVMAVRNLEAFKVMIDAFQKCENEHVCQYILKSIQSIFNSDPKNYFILDVLHPLTQLIEKSPRKSFAVQKQIFQMVEFVAFQLHWVPSEELVTMGILFKNNSQKACQSVAIETFIHLITQEERYKDIFREIGLLEILTAALKNYSSLLREQADATKLGLQQASQEDASDLDTNAVYVFFLIEAIRLLIEGNAENSSLFRRCGGARCVHNLVPFGVARQHAIRVVQQLIIDGGNDDLGTLLGLMHSTPETEVALKKDVLASLLRMFTMNNHTRKVFQEVGGFIYVVSVLVSLEGSLSASPATAWKEVPPRSILELVWIIFQVLVVAMQDEPVNKVVFMDEVRFRGLTETLRLLGCFQSLLNEIPPCSESFQRTRNASASFVTRISDEDVDEMLKDHTKQMQFIIVRCLFNMALGINEIWENEDNAKDRLIARNCKSMKVIHAGAVLAIVDLLPSLCDVWTDGDIYFNELSSNLLMHVVDQLQLLLSSEQNQQVMCESGLPSLLLRKCKHVFFDECHPLNSPITKLFERLAAQSISPNVFRSFLRLGSPLCSKSPYALLRAHASTARNGKNAKLLVSSGSRDESERRRSHSFSFRILDGDLQLGLGKSKTENIDEFKEENELHSSDDDDDVIDDDVEDDVIPDLANIEPESELLVDTCSIDSNSDDKVPSQRDYESDSPAEERRASREDSNDAKDGDERPAIVVHKELFCGSEDAMLDPSLTSEEWQEEQSNLKKHLVPRLHTISNQSIPIHDSSKTIEKFEGKQLPQNLIKSLVSISTPRDLLGTDVYLSCSFTEFDMSHDGFSCLLIPSLLSLRSGGGASATALERTFPPPVGLTYSAWVSVHCISKSNYNPIRLLTLQRKSTEFISDVTHSLHILSLVIDLKNNELVVNTEESTTMFMLDDKTPRKSSNEARINIEKLLKEETWFHLAVILNRSVLKTSSLTVYGNGHLLRCAKIRYVHPGLPTGAEVINSRIVGCIGTHPSVCHMSNLMWRLGPMLLLEEPLSADIVKKICSLGPGYSGSFQAPVLNTYLETDEPDILAPLVSEEKILLSLSASNMYSSTISKIKNYHSHADAKAVADELKLQLDDRHTPIHLMKNCATHLQGLPRGIGAVLVGNAGIRTFSPFNAASACLSIGGMKVLLSMIAMSSNLEDLYASLKALTCTIQGSAKARREMMRIKGHEILAFLLKRKSHLLNTHILHLVFSLVGTVQSEQESASIPNITAFQDILCDLEMWHSTPADLERSLYFHFYELLTQGSESLYNVEQMRVLGLVSELLHVLQDANIKETVLHAISSIISVLLGSNAQLTDLLRIGQFLASTLPDKKKPGSNEKALGNEIMTVLTSPPSADLSAVEQVHAINIRNALLDVLLKTLFSAADNSFAELMYKVLGFDWLLLFVSASLHSSTVVRGVRMLVKVICSSTTALDQFYSGSGGGWLDDSQLITSKRSITAAGFDLLSIDGTVLESEVNKDAFKVKGFPLLVAQLESHTDVNEIYFLLFALLLGHPLTEIHAGLGLSMESLYLMFWPSSATEGRSRPFQLYCCDAALVILHMMRVLMNKPADTKSKPDKDVSTILLDFIKFLYQNVMPFSVFCHQKLFLQYLAATLFPFLSKEDTSSESDNTLSELSEANVDLIVHPCCDTVYGFIKLISLDILDFSPVKAKQIFDNLLESYLSDGLLCQQKEYQTAVLSCIMDAILLGEVINSNISSNVLQNINMLAVSMVDKLWNGYFTKGYRPVLSFHISVISALDNTRANVDLLYHSLNRTILYQFSRPQARITDHTTMLDFLYVLRSNSQLIFSLRCKDVEFAACFVHWLFVVGNQEEVLNEDTQSQDTGSRKEKHSSQSDWRSLLAGAVDRVWLVFYTNKKQEIEEAFKQVPAPTFTSYGHDQSAVGSMGKVDFDLQSARALYGDLAAKMWMSVISNEERRRGEALGSQVARSSSKSAMSRLSIRIWKEKDTEEVYDTKEILDWYSRHVCVVRALMSYYHEKHQHEVLLRSQRVGKRWMMMEEDLTRERALWGPEEPNPLDKWMIDVTEGPCRMRKRMCKNDLFYMLYPPLDKMDTSLPTKYKPPRSLDSEKVQEACNRYLLADGENTEADNIDFTQITKSCTLHDFDNETYMGEVSNQTLFQMLESGDKIFSMYRCARVRGLDSAEGLFLMGKNHVYIVDGFTLLSSDRQSNTKQPTREIKDIESLPPGTHDPLIPDAKGNSVMRRTFSKWSYGDVREIHRRRYLLQDIALEIFSHNGSNNFLVFPTEIAKNKVYSRLQRASATYLANAQESLVGMKADANVETSGNLFSSFKGDKASVTSRWVRGEITNFQYLMHLNTLAGRSYNDLMQYPIFPWILADYDSEELDLTDPATFRDFTKPMGAQTPIRLAQFEKRYAEWEDPTGETPAYHYGTHYSSAMIVASYLIRLEPFTQYFLRLQGGHFDLADRLFYSIKEAWQSASEANMTDIKELVPEFFYLPEFLVNSNNFDLGKKQNGMEIGDVHLPRWAKGDHREFIRVHRKALECDYVSAHLHEWIDLVFGFKQQGQEAVDAHNVFHHLFYKGSVDFKNIQDPLKRNATISFINNFGQMPKQLFTRSHPVKKSYRDVDTAGALSQTVLSSTLDRYFTHHLASLVPSVQPVKELNSAVGSIVVGDKYLVAADKFKLVLAPLHNRYIAWGFGDCSLRYCSVDDKVLNVFEDVLIGKVECAASLSDDSFVTGGSSTIVSVWKLEKNRDKVQRLQLEKLLYGHQNTVTCVAVSLSYNLIISGSEDCTCIIWDSRRLTYVRQLTDHNGAVSCIAINNLSGDIVSCSGTWMYVWSVNGDLIVRENTAAAMSAQILTCAVSEVEEWDESNVMLTGSSDGVVRIWGIDYVNPTHSERGVMDCHTRRLSRSDSDVHRTTMKSIAAGSDSRLNALQSSALTESHGNLGANLVQRSLDDDAGEYVLVSKTPPRETAFVAPVQVWERKIVLRHKFTMHTSFGRLDNSEPAAITALAISKDHRKVFVGDGRGRVYSWSVSDTVGRIADHWVKDEGAQLCSGCRIKFTFTERRHHCRNCGKVFCGKCSRYEAPIAQLSIFKAVRVCKRCHAQLKGKFHK